MAHPLDGCFLKIERANEHIEDLNAEYIAHASKGPYRVIQEYDADNGALIFKFADVEEPPRRLTVIIGDALHQLRSALDHVIHQLIFKHRGTSPPVTQKTQFPIFKTIEGYTSRGRPMIQGVSTSAEAIIDSLQPYHRGANAEEDALWVLRELNNVDKHRLLLVTTITMEGPLEFEFNPPLRVDLRDRPKGAIDMEFFHGGPIKNGGVFARFRTTSSEVKMDRKPFSTVAFDEAGFARGKPVIPLLSETSGIVREIIESFRSEFI